TGADADGFQAVEHVQLGQAQTGDAVDLDGTAQDHGVEPAATAGTPRCGAELVATLGQEGPGVVEQFGRERTGTNTGGVGLGDTEDVVQVQRTETGTGSGTAGRGVGTGDVG